MREKYRLREKRENEGENKVKYGQKGNERGRE